MNFGKKNFNFLFFGIVALITLKSMMFAEPPVFRINFEEGDLPSLHPHILQGHARGRVLALLLYEGLTGVDEDGNAILKHAKSAKISDDQLTYTFELHSRSWSDGTPVLASDYERAWKLAVDAKSGDDYGDLLYIIKNSKKIKQGEASIDSLGVKAFDDHTLHVELEYPTPYFLKVLAQPLFLPLPKNDLSAFNGPFVIDSHKKDKLLTLKKNRNFWGHTELTQIAISFVSNPQEFFEMYQRGELDFLGEPISRLSNEAVAVYQKNGELKAHYPLRFFWVFMNTEKPPFSNALIRKAFSTSLDREYITSSILMGDIPMTTAFSKKLSSTDKQVIDANQEEAKRLFLEGMRQENYSEKNFPPITLSHFINVSGFTELAEYMQKTWSETFSIPIKLKGSEWNQFFSELQQGDFQVGGCSFDSHCLDPIEFFNRFEQKDSFNFSQWVSHSFREKLSELRHSINTRDQLIKEAEEILLEEMPIIPVCSHVNYYVLKQKWDGITIEPSGTVNFSKVRLQSGVD